MNSDKEVLIKLIHALNTQAPPASLIFFSANFENNFAFTITGTLGNYPFPNTLKYPYNYY